MRLTWAQILVLNTGSSDGLFVRCRLHINEDLRLANLYLLACNEKYSYFICVDATQFHHFTRVELIGRLRLVLNFDDIDPEFVRATQLRFSWFEIPKKGTLLTVRKPQFLK